MNSPNRKPDEVKKGWGESGQALLIPTLMLSGPVVGFGMGYGLSKLFNLGNWIVFIFVVLGFFAGIRESILILKRISKD